jgi:hypothetical protein
MQFSFFVDLRLQLPPSQRSRVAVADTSGAGRRMSVGCPPRDPHQRGREAGLRPRSRRAATPRRASLPYA